MQFALGRSATIDRAVARLTLLATSRCARPAIAATPREGQPRTRRRASRPPVRPRPGPEPRPDFRRCPVLSRLRARRLSFGNRPYLRWLHVAELLTVLAAAARTGSRPHRALPAQPALWLLGRCARARRRDHGPGAPVQGFRSSPPVPGHGHRRSGHPVAAVPVRRGPEGQPPPFRYGFGPTLVGLFAAIRRGAWPARG